MEKNVLQSFVDEWLASWTGNRPDILLDFYTRDAFYLDPANPKGLSGKEQLFAYFKRLLHRNPNWKWTEDEIFLTEKGFTIKWRAEIPVAQENLIIYGLDIVEMTDNKISRNEVYFDRYDWLMKMTKNGSS